MGEPRIIKKYPNRRLYDTAISAYVTLDAVRQLVLDSVPFIVVEKKSGQDITRNVLMQIISEQEEKGGVPVFGVDLLSLIIRYYGNSMQGLLGEYLLQNMQIFQSQQDVLQERMGKPLTRTSVPDFVDFISKNANQNINIWSSWQKNIISTFDKATAKEKSEQDSSAGLETPEKKKKRSKK